MKTRKTRRQDLRSLAEKLVGVGLKAGADEIEVTIYDGHQYEIQVRQQQIENLVEADPRYCSVRIFKDKRKATFSTSDLSWPTLYSLVKKAIIRASRTQPDELAGLPPTARYKVDELSLKLADKALMVLKPEAKIKMAMETERIGLSDCRIINSFGARFETNELKTILVSSNGFSGDYFETEASLSLGLQAGDGNQLVEDYWFSSARHLKDLASPEEIARKAIERTARQLNTRKIETQEVPVIFEPTMTSWLLAFLFQCVSGQAVYQRTTFLADRLGEKIGNDKILVLDDGLLPGKLGSRPFDAEGVPTQTTRVIDAGVLKNFLCDTYAGRKLGLASTGNAEPEGIGPNNFYLERGQATPEQIIRSTRKGLLLTRTIGQGLNPVTGDISRGASGLWIEDGEIAFPVSEIAISGNLKAVLNSIEMIGSDLDFSSQICGPSIKIAEMTVAGL
ncbi:MAG TPA: TldD/PmbA family protein [Candidatus Saccharicenans sp.]|nr:TldD/PmbA family protein [Candidatus Saccharicenans sp.]